jgi:uncharacterized membrane protein
MSDQPVVLAVATYRSRAAAESDFDAVWGVKQERGLDQVAAAVLEKGANGELEMRRHDSTAKHLAWGGALLGGAITVVAAPLGIIVLAPVVASGAEWAGVGAIVGHFWHNIPRDDLRKMSDLLEDGQAALVVVAVGHAGKDITALLVHAAGTIVTATTRADFEADFATAVEAAEASTRTSTGV